MSAKQSQRHSWILRKIPIRTLLCNRMHLFRTFIYNWKFTDTTPRLGLNEPLPQSANQHHIRFWTKPNYACTISHTNTRATITLESFRYQLNPLCIFFSRVLTIWCFGVCIMHKSYFETYFIANHISLLTKYPNYILFCTEMGTVATSSEFVKICNS